MAHQLKSANLSFFKELNKINFYNQKNKQTFCASPFELIKIVEHNIIKK